MIINYTSLLLIWTLLSESLGQKQPNNTNLFQFIKEFSHLYSNKFVVLIKPDNQTGERLLDLINIRNVFSRSLQFYTSIHDFKQFFTSFNEGNTRNLRMTTVYTSMDSIIIPDLNTMLKSKYREMLTWLCEIPSEGSISKLKEVMAPLNSRFFVVSWAEDGRAKVMEMYDIPRSDKQVNYFGEWDDKNGLRVGEKDLPKRRRNLKGAVTKFFIHSNLGDGGCNNKAHLRGSGYVFQCYIMEEWQFFGRYLNFTTEFQHYETKNARHLMVKEVRSGRCDTGPLALPISNRFKTHVHYMLPALELRVSLLAAIAGDEMSLTSFLKPFSRNFWMVLAALLAFMGIVLAILIHVVHRVAHIQESPDHFINFYIPFQALCSQGCTLETSWTGLRMILLICYIIPVIILTAYSGEIISSLAQPEQIPFRTLKEFEKNGEYKITTIHGLYPTVILKSDPKFEISRQRSLIAKKFVKDTTEAFEVVCTKKVIYFAARKILPNKVPKCKVYYLKDGEKYFFIARVISPHFPILEPLTIFQLKLKEAGINHNDYFRAAYNKYKFQEAKIDFLESNDDLELTLNPATIVDLMLLYTILLAGMGLSIVFLLFEIRANRKESILHKNLIFTKRSSHIKTDFSFSRFNNYL